MDRLRPLDQLSADEARGVRGIFCDIDDTLTQGGRLVPEAYAALCNAAKAGLRVVPVTGRPCGWAEVLASLWPVDAVIGEGGGGAATPHGWIWWDDEPTRAAQRRRLDAILADVRARLPHVRLAGDHALRRVDLAFDIGERARLDGDQRAALLDLVRSHGARTQVSTVHAHAVLGSYDKAQMAVRLAAALWRESAADLAARYLFVGDSPNDQAGFAFFPLSVGVANVRRFAAALAPPPRYVTPSDGGHGFAELVATLLRLREC